MDRDVVDDWLSTLIADVEGDPKPLHPVIEEFKSLIERDAEVFMYFHQMFSQAPRPTRPGKNPAAPQVRDYHLMLRLFNAIMTRAPEFNQTDLVGFPINAILDWSMATEGGFAAFLNDKINAQFRSMLDEWARFLASPGSVHVLNEDPRRGWFGADALKTKAMEHFDQEFVCDPLAPHRGFKSWDDFFTRRFRPGARPVAAPEDDRIIVNACESAPYRLAHDVQARERFWIKEQPYSLEHMLAQDPFTPQFVGGTIYQAFLSALSYHRWHSPVSGKIVKAYMQPGSYYSQSPAVGYDPAAPNESQGYITAVATRAMIFIEADNRDIGLMCFMPVGMAEVSTCEITVKEGEHVKKGDQLGMFHFGGSTHCLMFRPQTKLDFDLKGQEPGLNSQTICVNEGIATVR